MSKEELSPAAGRRPRRFLSGAALLCVSLAMAHEGHAATARIRWLPRATGSVTGYEVYVRNGGSTHTDTPQWSGNPAAAADGSMSALVTYTPAPSGTNYFAVVAVGPSGAESDLSGELPTGTPDPCRADSCSSKTSCDFSNHPDGLPCDDAAFCNGPEACLAGVCDASATRNCADAIACTVDGCEETTGVCTHVGPPGCCPACDVRDPCLADACAEGDCTADLGTEIDVERLRLRKVRSGIKLAAKGEFIGDPSIDPASAGAIVELRAPDGTLLYASSIAGRDITAGASGRHYRFVARRSEVDPLANGLKRLDLRLKGSTWRVTAKAQAAELSDAFLEPTMTWMIRLGTACVRHLDMACDQRAGRSTCR